VCPGMVTVLKERHRVLSKGSKISNRERLWHLELTTLREQRIRGDLIETFKIMTGKERVDRSQFNHEAVEAMNQS